MEGICQKRRAEKVEGEPDFRPWAELAPDVLGLIFKNLKINEIFEMVTRVCKPWCKAIEGPYCWQKIDLGDGWSSRYKYDKNNLDRMLRLLVTRSSGFFSELYVLGNIKDHQISFFAEHAGSLHTLSLQRSSISDSVVEQVASKLSSLITLDLTECYDFTERAVEAIGTNCKKLESLTWKMERTWYPEFDAPPRPSRANEGRAIGRTMPKLKHLDIAYVNIDNAAALEILSGCPELETLNIKGCWLVHFKEEDYPNVKVVSVHHEDPEDKDYVWWDTWNDASSGISSPEPDYTSLIMDYYSL